MPLLSTPDGRFQLSLGLERYNLFSVKLTQGDPLVRKIVILSYRNQIASEKNKYVSHLLQAAW